MSRSSADDPASWRTALGDGARSIGPLLVGVVPFGLIFGVTAASSEMGGGLGFATSIIIFGGAAQLATVQLVDEGAALAVVIATALVIQSRHMMYSAALAPSFRPFPMGWRLGLPYLLTDQAFATSIVRYESVDDPGYRRWYFFGAGISLWLTWQLTTAAGVLVGAEIPEAWSLDFAIPLVFLALLVPMLKDRSRFVAAFVGGAVAVVAAELALNLGLIVASMAGIAAGIVYRRGTT